MYKIGEFSKLTNLSIRTLRYYNEIGLLIPEEVDIYTVIDTMVIITYTKLKLLNF